jgi:hypothetical protein
MNKITRPSEKMILPIHLRMSGFFRLVAVNAYTGVERELVPWFPNLILDAGLNRMGTASYIAAAQVGTGNGAPSVVETGLQNYRSGTTTIQLTETGTSVSPPYYGYTRKTFRFGLGAASGNLAEVGVGAVATTGQLFSRSLIVDGFGVPTTVTVLSDEYLDVSYELRCYAPSTTTSYNTVISGVTYACQTRPSVVTDQTRWAPLFDVVAFRIIGSAPDNVYYSGAIGAVTSSPSGTTASASTGTMLPYDNNSLHRDFQIFAGLDQGNIVGGIRSTFVGTTLGAFQTEFNPVIPKTNIQTLALIYRIGWGRYTPGSP